MKQIVAHKKIGSLEGILTVLALAAVLIILNFLIEFAGRLIGASAATIVFWALGILLALIVYRVYIMAFSFELTDDMLCVRRSYGKRERFIEDIYLHRILYAGREEDALKRYPGLKKARYLRRDCPIAPSAIVYENADGKRMIILQLNDEMLKELNGKRKK